MRARRSSQRGTTRLGWLDSRHTFSFGGFYDPEWMGFRTLRVINDDSVAPGSGFGEHPHRDMEIVSLVLEGALEHRDSMGNGSVIRPGEVQRMSAGSGVRHSEMNPSRERDVHFLQIWIEPSMPSMGPGYQQVPEPAAGADGWAVLASPDGRDGSVTVHQDAFLWRARPAANEEVSRHLAPGRGAWIHVLAGTVSVNGVEMGPGDGAGLEDTQHVRMTAGADGADVLLFELS